MSIPMWRVAERNRERIPRDVSERNRLALAEVLPGRLQPNNLAWAGYGSVDALRRATDEELLMVPQFGERRLRHLREWLAAHPPPPPAPLPDWLAEE